MESMYVQFVKKLPILSVVIMKTLQVLQISSVIPKFQINKIKRLC